MACRLLSLTGITSTWEASSLKSYELLAVSLEELNSEDPISCTTYHIQAKSQEIGLIQLGNLKPAKMPLWRTANNEMRPSRPIAVGGLYYIGQFRVI